VSAASASTKRRQRRYAPAPGHPGNNTTARSPQKKDMCIIVMWGAEAALPTPVGGGASAVSIVGPMPFIAAAGSFGPE